MNVSLSEQAENSIKALVNQGAYPTPEKAIEKAIEAGIKALQQQEAANNPFIDQERLKKREVARQLHLIEGNPFTPEDDAMFEMFDRQGWNDQQRIDHIKQSVRDGSLFNR